MQTAKRQSQNERVRKRKRARHNQMVQQQHDEELYEQVRLDPQTVEGQGRIKDIEQLAESINTYTNTKPVIECQPEEEMTYVQQFWKLLGY